jgi:hypothetical protein
MSTMQVVMFAASLILILGIAVAEQFHWLGKGRARTVLSFLAGAFIGASEERGFRRPFLLGLGLSMFSVNVVQAVLNVL